MKITTLTDNLVYKNSLCAEHGLSLYIELEDNIILFDTGQSDIFYNNSKILGKDISKVNHLIISHGHYDHTGGIDTFLEQNYIANIYLMHTSLNPKYNGKRYIGIKKSIINKLSNCSRVIEPDSNIHKIDNNIYLINSITRRYPTEVSNSLLTEIDGKMIKDPFIDEQFMIIKRDNGVVVITGCSHNGILNILEETKALFNLPIYALIGGIHTKDASNEYINSIIEYLKGEKIKLLELSHCTGIEPYFIIKSNIGDSCQYNLVGKDINIDI